MCSDATASSDSSADLNAKLAGGSSVDTMEILGKVRFGGIAGAGMISLLRSGNAAKNR
jgi:hypothetical protein